MQNDLKLAVTTKKPLAIICDIDETLCAEFDRPLAHACSVIAKVNRAVEVHYVTARPEASKKGTEGFLCDQRLPGWRNVHFCPSWRSTREHKTEVMCRLAQQYQIIVSIGDADEDEHASQAANVPFVRVTETNAVEGWDKIAWLIARATQDVEDPLARLFGA
jgi:predicted secreted acid phosphatase